MFGVAFLAAFPVAQAAAAKTRIEGMAENIARQLDADEVFAVRELIGFGPKGLYPNEKQALRARGLMLESGSHTPLALAVDRALRSLGK